MCVCAFLYLLMQALVYELMARGSLDEHLAAKVMHGVISLLVYCS